MSEKGALGDFGRGDCWHKVNSRVRTRKRLGNFG